MICFAKGSLQANEDFVLLDCLMGRITRGKHLLVLCLCHRDESAVFKPAVCTECIIKGDSTLGKRAGYAWDTARQAACTQVSEGKEKEIQT